MKASIHRQEACFIFPYPDQPPEMRGQSALIALYLPPIAISYQAYGFFILWVDQNHAREITNTVTFFVE